MTWITYIHHYTRIPDVFSFFVSFYFPLFLISYISLITMYNTLSHFYTPNWVSTYIPTLSLLLTSLVIVIFTYNRFVIHWCLVFHAVMWWNFILLLYEKTHSEYHQFLCWKQGGMKFIPNSSILNSYLYSWNFHFHELNGWKTGPMGPTVTEFLRVILSYLLSFYLKSSLLLACLSQVWCHNQSQSAGNQSLMESHVLMVCTFFASSLIWTEAPLGLTLKRKILCDLGPD